MATDCYGSELNSKHRLLFVGLCLVWAVTFTASSWTLKSDFELSAVTRWSIALIPIVFGAGAVLAYRNFLRSADELVQKIQLEGLAFGFGIGLIFGLGYQLLERAGAPPLAADDIGLVLIVGWILGQLIAARRYQ